MHAFQLAEGKILAHAGNGVAYGKTIHRNMDMLLRIQAWYDATKTRMQAGKTKVDPYVAA